MDKADTENEGKGLIGLRRADEKSCTVVKSHLRTDKVAKNKCVVVRTKELGKVSDIHLHIN